MSLFAQIKAGAEERGLKFVIIGGLAVNYYGYARDTADLDLLVSQTARGGWLELLASLGYRLEHDAGAFAQFAPGAQGAWPVDLMFVQEATFAPMLSTSHEVDMYGVRLRIPSLAHLMALKLHALKHTRAHRFLKDFQDLEGLVRLNRIDLSSEKQRQFFLKYGTLDLYEKLVRACSDT